MSEYTTGDVLTIVPRLIGSQSSRVRGVLTHENDKHWMIQPEGVTYSYNFTHEDWVIEEITAAPKPLPTEPGWYLTSTKEAVYLAADGYWTVPHAFGVTGEDMSKYAPFTRLRPESETSEKDLEFYLAIGADPEKLRAAAITLAKAGISGDEDIEAMVNDWYRNRNRWAALAEKASGYAEGRG